VTVAAYREFTLLCDYPGCAAWFGKPGLDRPRTQLRKAAARNGWVHVPAASGHHRDDEDFCPVHPPGQAVKKEGDHDDHDDTRH
jgi:hypothetical protein